MRQDSSIVDDDRRDNASGNDVRKDDPFAEGDWQCFWFRRVTNKSLFKHEVTSCSRASALINHGQMHMTTSEKTVQVLATSWKTVQLLTTTDKC